MHVLSVAGDSEIKMKNARHFPFLPCAQSASYYRRRPRFSGISPPLFLIALYYFIYYTMGKMQVLEKVQVKKFQLEALEKTRNQAEGEDHHPHNKDIRPDNNDNQIRNHTTGTPYII